jgi:hypothetical protein
MSYGIFEKLGYKNVSLCTVGYGALKENGAETEN